MNKEKLHAIYNDAQYADSYDDRFILLKNFKVETDFELEVLRSLIFPETKWLDVACGTGYFLNHFPENKRAGFDLSMGMMKQAIERNPSADFFRLKDMREPEPDWNNQWDLVTCMYYPYCYLDSVSEVETLIHNLYDWTSEGGKCFFPVCTFSNVGFLETDIAYKIEDPFNIGGGLYLTSITWSWDDPLGYKHENLVTPHIKFLEEVFLRKFSKIEIIDYPEQLKEFVSPRKAIIATK